MKTMMYSFEKLPGGKPCVVHREQIRGFYLVTEDIEKAKAEGWMDHETYFNLSRFPNDKDEAPKRRGRKPKVLTDDNGS